MTYDLSMNILKVEACHDPVGRSSADQDMLLHIAIQHCICQWENSTGGKTCMGACLIVEIASGTAGCLTSPDPSSWQQHIPDAADPLMLRALRQPIHNSRPRSDPH